LAKTPSAVRHRVGGVTAGIGVPNRPFLINWLGRQGLPDREREDLAQEILVSVVRYLPSFQHPGHPGAFRSWLRAIAGNRLSDYWRALRPDEPVVKGGSAMTEMLNQFADPDSELNRCWDEEHDRYVLRCLLDLVEQEFEPKTFRAFRRLALDDATGAQVGDPGLMSPAVDVYALGVSLYQLLTGQPPFRGESPGAVLRASATDPPVAPRRIKSHVPRDLETIALKAIEKEPAHRYRTAAALSAKTSGAFWLASQSWRGLREPGNDWSSGLAANPVWPSWLGRWSWLSRWPSSASLRCGWRPNGRMSGRNTTAKRSVAPAIAPISRPPQAPSN
jgi:RNA polymerase sigma-70 factor, ECF subfamily